MISEHDRLLERYIGGEMNGDEEREFLTLAEHDPDLRDLLRAERAIISGTRKERLAMPAAPAKPGSALLARLAATSAAPETTVANGLAIFRNATVRWAIAAAAVLGIIIGMFVLSPLSAPEPAVVNGPAPADTGTTDDLSNQQPGAYSPGPDDGTAQSSPIDSAGNAPRLLTEPEQTGAAPQARARRQSASSQPHTFPLDEGDGDPVIFDNDTVKVRISP